MKLMLLFFEDLSLTYMEFCSRSIHNRVSKFYVGHQLTTTLLFPGLGSTENKIWN